MHHGVSHHSLSRSSPRIPGRMENPALSSIDGGARIRGVQRSAGAVRRNAGGVQSDTVRHGVSRDVGNDAFRQSQTAVGCGTMVASSCGPCPTLS